MAMDDFLMRILILNNKYLVIFSFCLPFPYFMEPLYQNIHSIFYYLIFSNYSWFFHALFNLNWFFMVLNIHFVYIFYFGKFYSSSEFQDLIYNLMINCFSQLYWYINHFLYCPLWYLLCHYFYMKYFFCFNDYFYSLYIIIEYLVF
jgi:hypothetical protein